MSTAYSLHSNEQLSLTSVPAGVPLLTSELYHLLGWDGLSASLKKIVEPDIHDYVATIINEEPVIAAQEQRRRRIVYWIDAYRTGMCSEQTALLALAD
jgi:hypothetical protein